MSRSFSAMPSPALSPFTLVAIVSVPLVLVLGNAMLVPILPQLQQKLHITAFQSSLVITLFSLTAAVCIPIAGFASDRIGRKNILCISLFIYGLGGLGAALAAGMHTYAGLLLARAIQGIGAAGTSSIAMAFIGDVYEGKQESRALGIHEAANGIGKVISPILGAMLAGIAWTAPFWAFPLFCACSFALVYFAVPTQKKSVSAPHKTTMRQEWGTLRLIFKQKGSWIIAAASAGSFGLFSLFGMLFYLSEVLERPPFQLGMMTKGFVLAIPLAGLVIAATATGYAIQNKGNRMRIGMLVGVTLSTAGYGMMWLLNPSSQTAMLTWIAVSSMGTGLLLPCVNALITGAVSKAQRGLITALYNSMRFFGVAVGPPIIGALMVLSDRTVFMVLTLVSVVGGIGIVVAVKPPAQLAATTEPTPATTG